MNSKYNYEYETFRDMLIDNVTGTSIGGTITEDKLVDTIANMMYPEYSGVTMNTTMQGNFLWNIANYLYTTSNSTSPNSWIGFRKIASAVYFWFQDLKPLYIYNEMCRQMQKYTSIANKKLPNFLSIAYIQSLLTKYGLPVEIFRFSTNSNDWGKPDFSQLDDFLVWRYLKDNTSTDYTGNEKSEGTGASSSTTSDSGTGRQWNRSRPINYTTTDETTADSVQGQSSESSGTDVYESSDTLNRDTTNNTERERILTERRTTLLQFMKELTGVLDNWIADLVQSLNPCFVQEMGI